MVCENWDTVSRRLRPLSARNLHGRNVVVWEVCENWDTVSRRLRPLNARNLHGRNVVVWEVGSPIARAQGV